MRRSRHEHTPTADDLTASPPSTPHKRHRRDGDDAIATSVELNVAHLPRELLSHIISYLKRIELLRNASAVCREWRLVALTLISSLTPKSFSRGLLAKMTGLKKMCVGCLGKHRHSHPIELPGVRDLSLSSSDVCDCALWTRLPSLTALTIFLRKTHPCALSVLSKVASSLQKLTLGQEDEIFDPPLTEIVSTVTLPALRELHLIRQESVNFACILLSNAGLAARLTSLTIQVCSSDHQSPAHLTALLATIPMPSLTSASLLFKPSAAAISAFLDRAPALKELALGVHTGVFGAVAAQVSSLLVGLHLVHPDAQTVGFVRLCTRLTAIVPLPATASGGQYWDESNWAPLYIPLAPLLLKLRQPATAKLGTFTSLTSLRICSKFSAFCEDIRLPHLRKIAWGLYPYSTEEPTHKVAYIMRRFLSWSDVLYRISCKLPGLTFRTAADTDEMTFFLNLAERHPALEELSFRFKEAQFDDTDVQTLMKTRRNLRIKCKKDPMRPAAVGDAPVVPQPVALAAAVNNAAQAPVHLPPPPAANVPPPPPPAPGGQQ